MSFDSGFYKNNKTGNIYYAEKILTNATNVKVIIKINAEIIHSLRLIVEIGNSSSPFFVLDHKYQPKKLIIV